MLVQPADEMALADLTVTFPYLEEGHQGDRSAWWEDGGKEGTGQKRGSDWI